MFSHSRINAFKQCPKMYQYKYIDNLEPIGDSEELNLGKAFHRGIELNSVNELAKELDEDDYFSSEENETNKVIALAMVEAFLKKFPNHNEGKVEHEVHIETNICGEENDFQMYADAIKEVEGGLILREYKTASRIDSVYLDKLEFNDQISRYCYVIEKHYKKPIIGIEYYIAKKPLLRQKQSESLEQYRARLVERLMEDDNIVYVNLHRTKEQIQESFEDMKFDINNINNTHRFTQNLSNCSCYGGCPYLNLCCKKEDAMLLYVKREENDENDETTKE